MKFSTKEITLIWIMNITFFAAIGMASTSFGHSTSVVMGLAVAGGVFTRLLQNAVRDLRIADKGDVNWLLYGEEEVKRNA